MRRRTRDFLCSLLCAGFTKIVWTSQWRYSAERIPERIGPTPVVRARQSPNGGRIWRSCTTGMMRSDGIQTHGEGQALALREGDAFFHRIAGPVTATLSDL